MIRVNNEGGRGVVVGRDEWLVAGLIKIKIMKMS